MTQSSTPDAEPVDWRRDTTPYVEFHPVLVPDACSECGETAIPKEPECWLCGAPWVPDSNPPAASP